MRIHDYDACMLRNYGDYTYDDWVYSRRVTTNTHSHVYVPTEEQMELTGQRDAKFSSRKVKR